MKIDKKFYKKKENIQSLYDIESSKVLKIISFGSDKRFLGLSEKVLISLKKIYPNSYCKNYQKTDLDASILNYCNQYKKGYGYWIWKPYLILKSLRQLPIGANLLYVDGQHPSNKAARLSQRILFEYHAACFFTTTWYYYYYILCSFV